MKSYRVLIVGGGASGMLVATLLGKKYGSSVAILERNDRVGKKLLATGNGLLFRRAEDAKQEFSLQD